MINRIIPFLTWIAFVSPSAIAAADKTEIRGANRTEFHGWRDALRLDSRATLPKAVLVPGLGGRIMSYGFRDENLLWVNPETVGRTFSAGDAPFEPGGFYCDLGPEVASLPPHPLLGLGPFEVSTKRKALITLRGPEEKTLGIEMEKEVMFDPVTGDLGFVHRIRNSGDRDGAFTLWHRIACRPGGFAFFPVNKKSRFASGWALGRDEGGRLRYDATSPQSPAVSIMDGILVARTGGPLSKIGADTDAQWLAYVLGRNLFVIHFPYYSGAVYAESGNSVTIAWNESRTELQPIAPESRLRPRKSYDFPIKWSLVELPSEVTTPEAARALAGQVPASPFL